MRYYIRERSIYIDRMLCSVSLLKDIENTLHEKIQDLSDTLKQMQWEKDLKEATEMLFGKSKNDTIIHI